MEDGVIRRLLVVVLVSSVAVASCDSAPEAGSPFQWTREPWSIDTDVPVSSVEFAGRHLGIGRAGGLLVAEDGTWSPVELPVGDSGSGEVKTRAIAASGDALVIVGLIDERPVAWVSADGTSWTLSTDADLGPPPGNPQAEPEMLAAGADGFVVAGTAAEGSERQRPVTWFSRDGLDWEAPVPLSGTGPRAIRAVEGGYVLAAAGDARGSEFTRADFWWSPDGREWTMAEDAAFGGAEPAALAVVPDGGLVAVGFRTTSAGLAPMAWTSTSGREWLPADDTPALAWWPVAGPTPAPGSLKGTMMTGVATLPGQLLAVGVRFGIDPNGTPDASGNLPLAMHGALWTSADGRRWEALDDSDFELGRSFSGAMEYGLVGVATRAGEVQITGRTADLGWTMWRSPLPAE